MSRRVVFFIIGGAALCALGPTVASRPQPAPVERPLMVPRRDAAGDPLPPAAIARMGSLRLLHGGSVSLLAFLPDDKTLVSVGEGSPRAWDPVSGMEKPLPFGKNGAASGFALSPNGRLVACMGSDHMMRIQDLQTGRLVREWMMGENHAQGIAFSPDNRIVAWADGNSHIHLRDLQTDRDQRVLKGHEDAPIVALVFSPDGKSLLSAGPRDGILHWDLVRGKRLRRFGSPISEVPPNASAGVFFHRDGRSVLFAANPSTLMRYETDSIEEKYRIATEQGSITFIAMSADGKIVATAGADGTVKLWNGDNGKALKTWPADSSAIPVAALAFSHDGKTLAAGTVNGKIRLYDVIAGKERQPVQPNEAIAIAAFSADGKEVFTVQPNRLARWTTATGTIRGQSKLDGGVIIGAAFSPDRRLLALARENMGLTMIETEKAIERAATGAVYQNSVLLNFTPDSRLLLAFGPADPQQVRAFSTATGKESFSLKNNIGEINQLSMALSRDGRCLLVGGAEDGIITSWELTSAQQRRRYTLPIALRSNRDGRQMMLGIRGGMVVGDSNTSSRCAGMSPDGRYVALLRAELLYLFDLRTETVQRCFCGASKPLTSVAFSPDGQLVAAGSEDRLVRLWDARTAALRGTLAGHRDKVSQVDFSANGDRLLSVSDDGTVVVWDVAEAQRQPEEKQNLDDPRAFPVLWVDLASDDGAVVERARLTLEDRSEETVTFLAGKLQPVREIDAGRIAQLIAELNHDQVEVRERASEQLGELEELAESALRKALDSPLAEVRRRAQRLVDPLDRNVLTGARARPIRALEILERIGTSSARRILARLAEGAPAARLTRESRAALQRLRTVSPEDKTVR